MKYTTEYTPPTLTVDAVIFQLVGDQLMVLLIQRPRDPFAGHWALPGGYCPEGETTIQALERVVTAKAGVSLARDVSFVEQLYTFDTVARDPRGHAVSVTYMGCGRDIVPHTDHVTAFFPVHSLPDLAYDHAAIIEYAHERLIAKLMYTNAAYALLPTTFTFSDLQTAYETVFGYELDKRNFRKKFQSQNMFHETGDMQRAGAHRPAKLYAFNNRHLESLPKNFD